LVGTNFPVAGSVVDNEVLGGVVVAAPDCDTYIVDVAVVVAVDAVDGGVDC
jgi:hypothetical protein